MIVASFDIGEKNLAFIVGNVERVVEMKHINVKRCKTQAVTRSCELISAELTTRDWTDCQRVLIERQMTRNVRAQRIAQHVWTWFRILYPNIPIEFVSASLKTKSAANMSYAQRKKWAVVETTRLLSNNNDSAKHWLTYMASLPKADDVSDAYLQMIAWFERKNIKSE